MEELEQALQLDSETLSAIYAFIIANAGVVIGLIITLIKSKLTSVSKSDVDAIVETKVNEKLDARMTRIETGYEETNAMIMKQQKDFNDASIQKLDAIEQLKQEEIELQKTQFEELIANAELE